MARLGVTYQDIANAADQIIGQGKQPTIELIRNLLGTGSSTTIANHLRSWRAEQEGSTSIAIKENLPQEFISVMKGLWQRLQAHADNQVEVVKREAELSQRYMKEEIEKYKTNNQRWQKMFEGWGREKDALLRDKLSLEQAVVSLQTEVAGLAAKLNGEEQRMNEKQQRIDELNRLHKLAQENLEHYRESARVQRLIDQEKHSAQVQQLELAVREAQQQCMVLHQDKVVVENKLEKSERDAVALQEAHDQLRASYMSLQTEYKTMEKEQDDSRREASHYQKQCTLLEIKLADQQAELMKQQKQEAVNEHQLTQAKEEINDLKEQNKFLVREKWEIAQEKAQLEGINKQMQKVIRSKEILIKA